MTSHQTFSDLAAQLRDFIGSQSMPASLLDERKMFPPLLGERAGHAASSAERVRASLILDKPETDFNRLALSLFALQYSHNLPFRRFCESRRASPDSIEHWSEIPAIPAVAFKEFELTSLPAAERARVFHSSGTTTQRPGRHFHDTESLSLYETSLLPWFQTHLLPEFSSATTPHSALRTPHSNVRFLSLTPPPELTPHSSLVHMFATIHRQFGAAGSAFAGLLDPDAVWQINLAQSLAILRDAIAHGNPIVVMGTAFNFLQLADHLEDAGHQLTLPAGSRVLETGGYKGRTRSLSKPELHALIAHTLGVPPARIISEYGMSELSSQAYDSKIDLSNVNPGTLERTFHFPPWAHVQIVSPETGREVADGETGLIRIFDLANLHSVLAVQTEDLGIRRGEGFELLGRAALAEARGCSLMSA